MSNGTGRFKNIAIGYEDGYTLTTDRRLDISGNVDISGALTVNGSPVGGGPSFVGFHNNVLNGPGYNSFTAIGDVQWKESHPLSYKSSNVGSAWNGSTGMFTCTTALAGKWRFKFQVNSYHSQSVRHTVRMRKGGGNVREFIFLQHHKGNYFYEVFTGEGFFDLIAGDTVRIYNDVVMNGVNTLSTTFSGEKVG
jgi:hypothetical protein